MLTKKDLIARLYEFSTHYCDIDDIYIDYIYLSMIPPDSFQLIFDVLQWVDDNCNNEIGLCIMKDYLDKRYGLAWTPTISIDICKFAWYLSRESNQFQIVIKERIKYF